MFTIWVRKSCKSHFIMFLVPFPTSCILELLARNHISKKITALRVLSGSIPDCPDVLIAICILNGTFLKLIVMEDALISGLGFVDEQLAAPTHLPIFPRAHICASGADIGALWPMPLIIDPGSLVEVILIIVVVFPEAILHAIAPLTFVDKEERVGPDDFEELALSLWPSGLEVAMILMLVVRVEVLAVSLEESVPEFPLVVVSVVEAHSLYIPIEGTGLSKGVHP